MRPSLGMPGPKTLMKAFKYMEKQTPNRPVSKRCRGSPPSPHTVIDYFYHNKFNNTTWRRMVIITIII